MEVHRKFCTYADFFEIFPRTFLWIWQNFWKFIAFTKKPNPTPNCLPSQCGTLPKKKQRLVTEVSFLSTGKDNRLPFAHYKRVWDFSTLCWSKRYAGNMRSLLCIARSFPVLVYEVLNRYSLLAHFKSCALHFCWRQTPKLAYRNIAAFRYWRQRAASIARQLLSFRVVMHCAEKKG